MVSVYIKCTILSPYRRRMNKPGRKVVGVISGSGEDFLLYLPDFFESVGPMDALYAIELGYVDE